MRDRIQAWGDLNEATANLIRVAKELPPEAMAGPLANLLKNAIESAEHSLKVSRAAFTGQ